MSCINAPQSQHPPCIWMAISCQLEQFSTRRSRRAYRLPYRGVVPDNGDECFISYGWKEGTECHIIIMSARYDDVSCSRVVSICLTCLKSIRKNFMLFSLCERTLLRFKSCIFIGMISGRWKRWSQYISDALAAAGSRVEIYGTLTENWFYVLLAWRSIQR